eukprot:6472582-Amphidinium_carterae.2
MNGMWVSGEYLAGLLQDYGYTLVESLEEALDSTARSAHIDNYCGFELGCWTPVHARPVLPSSLGPNN